MMPTLTRTGMASVLIVEDDESQRETLCAILQEEGLFCQACCNAKNALQQLQQRRFSVVVVDFRLPDMSGIELLTEIHRYDPKMPVIIHTAYGSFDSAKDAVNHGAFAYLEKVQGLERLINYVHRAIHEHMLRIEQELSWLQQQALEIADQEQRHVGQELHNGTQQELAGLAMMVATMVEKIESKGTEFLHQNGLSECYQMAIRFGEIVERINRGIGILSRGWVALDVEAVGLQTALQYLADNINQTTTVTCECHSDPSVEVSDPAKATHLYRIAQEATRNALKHAQAHCIHIALHRDAQGVQLQIEDDGIGIHDQDLLQPGIGIRIMQYRAYLLEADLRINGSPLGGTMINCRVPAVMTSCQP